MTSPEWFQTTGVLVDGWHGHYTSAAAYEILRRWGWDPGEDRDFLDRMVYLYLTGLYGDGKASGPVRYGPELADEMAQAEYQMSASELIMEVVDQGEEWATDQLPARFYCGYDYSADAWGIWQLDPNED